MLQPNLRYSPSIPNKVIKFNMSMPVSESNSPSDLVVFLDLDATLIFSELSEIHDDDDDKKSVGEEDIRLSYKLKSDDDGGCTTNVTVYKRPHLDFFLQEVSSRYAGVHLFTAAQKEHADSVLNLLDPTGTIFSKRFYRDSCRGPYDDPRKGILSLAGVEVDPNRFVHVDDNCFCMMDHPCNGIVVSGFNKESLGKGDKVLLKVLELLEELDGHQDVRPYLEKKFEMPFCKMMLEDLGMRIGATPIE